MLQARPPIGSDPYLLQIADRADDPAEATQIATDDPAAALQLRRETLRTLRDASGLLASDDPLRSDLTIVVGAYEHNVEGLEALVQGGGGFLPVGAGPEVVRPAQAVLDYEVACE